MRTVRLLLVFVLTLAAIFGIGKWAKSPNPISAATDRIDGVPAEHDDHAGHGDHEDHEGHEGHGDHEDHAGHEDHESEEAQANQKGHADQEHGGEETGHSVHEEAINLSAQELLELDLTLKEAAPGSLDIGVSLPGEVRLNEDRLAHVVPKLAGIVSEVSVSLGDHVKTGDVMAVLESRELATAKSNYLAAREHLNLASGNFERERKLWAEKISAQKDYLESQNELASARIALQGVRQELEALGFSKAYIDDLKNESGASLTQYVVKAPFDGTVISKHVALGEYMEANSAIFTVAD